MTQTNHYWKKRVENVKDSVKLRSLIDYYNIECESDAEITQLHCPFHGYDAHASARIYETNSMYCWVCSKTWDVIEFVKDYKNLKFKDAVVFLEDMYSIAKPSLEETLEEPSFESYLEDEKRELQTKDYTSEFDILSKMLKTHKDSIDFETYRRLFYSLDDLYANYRTQDFSHGLSLETALKNLHSEISSVC